MSNGELSPEQKRLARVKISEMLGIELAKVPEDFDSVEFKRLGLDSLDMVELVMEIEDDLDFHDDDPPFPLAPA